MSDYTGPVWNDPEFNAAIEQRFQAAIRRAVTDFVGAGHIGLSTDENDKFLVYFMAADPMDHLSRKVPLVDLIADEICCQFGSFLDKSSVEAALGLATEAGSPEQRLQTALRALVE